MCAVMCPGPHSPFHLWDPTSQWSLSIHLDPGIKAQQHKRVHKFNRSQSSAEVVKVRSCKVRSKNTTNMARLCAEWQVDTGDICPLGAICRRYGLTQVLWIIRELWWVKSALMWEQWRAQESTLCEQVNYTIKTGSDISKRGVYYW